MTRVIRRRGSDVLGRRHSPAVVEAIESRQLMTAFTTIVDVPISAAARASDPTLSSLRTVDVKLTVLGGDDWLASDFLIKLTKGSFYNPRAGGNTPNKAGWSLLPYTEFDTFVGGPDFSAPTVLGRKEGTGSAVFSPSEVNVSFGDLASTGAGTFTLARLTFTPDAVGTIDGSFFTQFAPSTAEPIESTISPKTPAINGKVFNDLNANGKQDTGEPNLNKWQVYIDKDNDNKLDSNEMSVKTNSKGNYTFLNPGNNIGHRVRIRLQDGFRRSAPSSGSYNVSVSEGIIATDKNFGATQRGRISGILFRDTDGDKNRDSGEAGMSGWRVFIDKDGDNRFDTNEVNMRTLSDGSFSFNNLGPGTYKIRVTQVGGFTPTTGNFSVAVVNGTDSTNFIGQKPV
jgi:hypothetical protein